MRLTALLVCTLLLTVPVAAQGQAPDEGGDAGPPADAQPSLPQQASDTAKQVIDTVFNFAGDTFSSIGAALQNILGGDQSGEPSGG